VVVQTDGLRTDVSQMDETRLLNCRLQPSVQPCLVSFLAQPQDGGPRALHSFLRVVSLPEQGLCRERSPRDAAAEQPD
jgi:hypothetical protein